MEAIDPAWTQAIDASFWNGFMASLCVSIPATAFACLMVFCLMEKPAKFKSAPGFRPRNKLDGHNRPLSREQVEQVAAAKSVLRSHGYHV